jgi:Fe-S oxidoreductase
MLPYTKKRQIASFTAAELTKQKPDYLATACPLCKKTLASVTGTKVADIAEIVALSIANPSIQRKEPAMARRLVRHPADIT